MFVEGQLDKYGREIDPAVLTWNDISSSMGQARKLGKGVTLDQIQKGIFGNQLFDRNSLG